MNRKILWESYVSECACKRKTDSKRQKEKAGRRKISTNSGCFKIIEMSPVDISMDAYGSQVRVLHTKKDNADKKTKLETPFLNSFSHYKSTCKSSQSILLKCIRRQVWADSPGLHSRLLGSEIWQKLSFLSKMAEWFQISSALHWLRVLDLFPVFLIWMAVPVCQKHTLKVLRY